MLILMLSQKELIGLAYARIRDAEALLSAERFHGAVYLCGYAIEMALKERICNVLGWEGYPATTSEFKGYASFKTHDFDVLLHLSGCETEIKTKWLAEWSEVAEWNPEARYEPLESVDRKSAEAMISSAKKLLKEICN